MRKPKRRKKRRPHVSLQIIPIQPRVPDDDHPVDLEIVRFAPCQSVDPRRSAEHLSGADGLGSTRGRGGGGLRGRLEGVVELGVKGGLVAGCICPEESQGGKSSLRCGRGEKRGDRP